MMSQTVSPLGSFGKPQLSVLCITSEMKGKGNK